MKRPEMSEEELLALPVSVDILTAGRAFGLGRYKTYELVKRGKFPCRVLSVGPRYCVPRSALLEALGVDLPAAKAAREFRHSADLLDGPDPAPAA